MGRAKRLFSKPGHENATLKELARLSDLTPSSLYTYFSTKDQIVGAIIEDAWGWLDGEMRHDAEAKPDKDELLRQFCGMYMPEMLSDKNLASLIVQYPQAIPCIKEKLNALADILLPGLEAFSATYNGIPLDEHSRKAQSAILVLGCLCAGYFAANTELDFTEKDILNAFRAFVAPKK